MLFLKLVVLLIRFPKVWSYIFPLAAKMILLPLQQLIMLFSKLPKIQEK